MLRPASRFAFRCASAWIASALGRVRATSQQKESAGSAEEARGRHRPAVREIEASESAFRPRDDQGPLRRGAMSHRSPGFIKQRPTTRGCNGRPPLREERLKREESSVPLFPIGILARLERQSPRRATGNSGPRWRSYACTKEGKGWLIWEGGKELAEFRPR
jgi:hypothetical protein